MNRSELLKGCWVDTLWGALLDSVELRPDYQGWVESFELIVKVTGRCSLREVTHKSCALQDFQEISATGVRGKKLEMNLGIHSLLHLWSGEELGHGAQMQDWGTLWGGWFCLPGGIWHCLETFLVVVTCREGAVLLASRGERPVMLLDILQCKESPHN